MPGGRTGSTPSIREMPDAQKPNREVSWKTLSAGVYSAGAKMWAEGPV
jgi:hypothetical protein